jgi:hypothetical protein
MFTIKITPTVTAGIKQYEGTLTYENGNFTHFGENRDEVIKTLTSSYETKHVGKEADTVQ